MVDARLLAAVSACCVFLVGCSTAPQPEGSSSDSPATEPEQVAPESDPETTEEADSATPETSEDSAVIATKLQAPWSVVFWEDRALVSERDSGRILELVAPGEMREVGVVEGVNPEGEGGLLGLATYEQFLYAYYTSDTDNRVVRYPLVQGPSGELTLGARENIFTGIPSATYHNGGRIAFGPDGWLYIATGDAGASRSAQDPTSFAGKILRVTPEGLIPPDNPFPTMPVYSMGHRNPQGLAWAPDGTLYASEFGQDAWDELNIIEAGGNYGWPNIEGIGEDPHFTDPVQQWPTSEASPSGIAITGGNIYIANLRGERLRVVPLEDVASSSELLVGELGRLRDVVVTPSGEIWVVTNNTDGRGEPGPDDDRIVELD